jgi:hypothetical protein
MKSSDSLQSCQESRNDRSPLIKTHLLFI